MEAAGKGVGRRHAVPRGQAVPECDDHAGRRVRRGALSIGDTRGSGERKGTHRGEDDEPADHGEKRTVATHEG